MQHKSGIAVAMAAGLFRPLAQELPYAAGVAIKRKREKKTLIFFPHRADVIINNNNNLMLINHFRTGSDAKQLCICYLI